MLIYSHVPALMSPLDLYQLKGHHVSEGHADASSPGLQPIEFMAPQLTLGCDKEAVGLHLVREDILS